MHVHHIRPFLLPLEASPYAEVTRRKKPDDPEKVPPVRRRFDEEEGRDRSRQDWRNGSHQAATEADPAGNGENFETLGQSGEAAASSLVSPVDQLIEGLMAKAAASVAPAAHEGPSEPSLDDLLALMRVEPPKA